MIGFLGNIEKLAKTNESFRQVLYTGQHTQLVVMSLKPLEEIGYEVHEIVDQFFRIESGEGKLFLGTEKYDFKQGDAFIIPAATRHNVVNTSSDMPLKLYTLYSPPHHKDGIVHASKKDAETDQSDHL